MGENMNIDESQIKEIVADAKDDFDLESSLRGRPIRTDKITLYTDEVTGARHQEVEAKLQSASDAAANLKLLAKMATTWSLGDEAAYLLRKAKAATASDKVYAALEKESDALKAELHASSFTFSLRALPPIITKDVRRITKKKLKIKGDIPQERVEDFIQLSAAVMLSKMVTRWVRNKTGVAYETLSVKDAMAIINYLPPTEWKRLDDKLADLSSKNSIAESVISDADFSPAI